MVGRFHLDTDFLVFALSIAGPERERLRALVDGEATLETSSVAWYEFCRGQRTPEQTAVARDLFARDGIIPLDEPIAERAAEEFRRLGSPRKRAADIAIGVTAVVRDAVLLSRNAEDFEGIEGLRLEAVRP